MVFPFLRFFSLVSSPFGPSDLVAGLMGRSDLSSARSRLWKVGNASNGWEDFCFFFGFFFRFGFASVVGVAPLPSSIAHT